MTLEEAIRHCINEVYLNQMRGCDECAAEHEQLAEWLTELKQRREAEITAPTKSNEEHTAAYWMQKTMDAVHEAYDRLKDTVDFKNAIAEAEAIKQRMGLGEKKKITNADRIPQMTDEELAVFMIVQALMGAASANGISDRQSAEDIVKEVIKSKSAEIDIENAKDWLKQEVSEDAR